jgi:hypothetical protein
MNSKVLDRLNADIQRLTLAEQVWLMERLVQSIRVKTMRQQHVIENQLAAMAADPEIQREISQIQTEFAGTESDGLTDDS